MELLLAVTIIFVGSLVQSAIGIGLALISAPLLLLIDPLYVPAPVTVSALTLSVANALHYRRAISLQGLKFALLGRVPGTVVGGLLLLWINQKLLALWLGITVIIAVAVSVSRLAFTPTHWTLATAGFFSGFMGTSTAIGGPPMALVMQHQTGDYIRGNLAAFFVVSCLMSLAMLAAVGRFGEAELIRSLPLMPATLAGYWLAMRLVHRISHRMLRAGSLILCAVAGLAAVTSYWL